MMRFGEQLDIWLDFLGLRQDGFAKLCKLEATYLSAIRRGLEGGGIDKPGDVNQKKIFRALEKAYGKPVDRDRFWQGPAPLERSGAVPKRAALEDLPKLMTLTFDNEPISEDEWQQVLKLAAVVRGLKKK